MSIDLPPQEETFAYFGFGSLVNRKTLPSDIVTAIPATLNGWKRHWQYRPSQIFQSEQLQDIALLSVHRDQNTSIEGLLVIDRLSNLPSLDKRERGYDRVQLNDAELDIKNSDISRYLNDSVYVYVARSADYNPADKKPLRLLRSYLDVVMQGFHSEFEMSGVERFIETTKGFPMPILEDRDSPHYPRHQQLSSLEQKQFDVFLK